MLLYNLHDCTFSGKIIPLIPPTCDHLFGKSKLNEFFTQQYNTTENNSTLPNDLVFETTERISFFDISKDEITKIIRSLDPNKAHGHDGTCICILKS